MTNEELKNEHESTYSVATIVINDPSCSVYEATGHTTEHFIDKYGHETRHVVYTEKTWKVAVTCEIPYWFYSQIVKEIEITSGCAKEFMGYLVRSHVSRADRMLPEQDDIRSPTVEPKELTQSILDVMEKYNHILTEVEYNSATKVIMVSFEIDLYSYVHLMEKVEATSGDFNDYINHIIRLFLSRMHRERAENAK